MSKGTRRRTVSRKTGFEIRKHNDNTNYTFRGSCGTESFEADGEGDKGKMSHWGSDAHVIIA